MTTHAWPPADQHLWSQWYPNTARTITKPATQYRACIHPDCHAVEYREAPKG